MRAIAHASDASERSIIVCGFLLLWTVAICIRDLVAPTNAISATLVAVLQPLWLLRISRHDTTWSADVLILLLVDYWSNGGLQLIRPGFYEWFHQTQAPHATIYSIFLIIGICSAIIVFRGDSAGKINSETANKTENQFLPPLLIPARTTHTRLFPKKHSFSYSYFYVGIPVGWKGRAGSALSADVDLLEEAERSYGWFHVDSKDHLDREADQDGFKGKLRRYLRSEGVEDGDWTFAYLVTAPRFLGYSFNPVSFWYIYNAEAELKMMVLEVNNTFGERRMYLLKATKDLKQNGNVTGEDLEGFDSKKDMPKNAVKFTNTWEKDFHVSPFNSRQGSYSLTASDPLSDTPGPSRMIDNTIVLRSSKEETKLVARVFSVGSPKNPASLTTWELSKFLLAWFWVGFVTFPRIVREAGKLYFKRGLFVWFRPEVLPSSIGRKHTSTEQILEYFFRAYLKDLTQQCRSPLIVNYTPPNGMGARATFESRVHDPSKSTVPETSIRITTPVFYIRFVHYAHTSEAFDREGAHAQDPKNRTIDVSDHTNLATLLETTKNVSKGDVKRSQGLLDRLRWSVLWRLRCPPPAVSYSNEKEASSNLTVTDIRSFASSGFDRFVLRYCDDAGVYRRIVTTLFLAQRYMFGLPAIITVLDLSVRVLLVAMARRTVEAVGGQLLFMQRWDQSSHWQSVVMLVVAVNAVHVWSLLKGVGDQ